MNLGNRWSCGEKEDRVLLVFNEKGKGQGQGRSTLLMHMVNLRDPPNHSTAPRQFLSPALNFEASWENVFYLF